MTPKAYMHQQESPEYLRGLIRKTRTLTDKPFGVGVVLAFPHEENVKAILDEKVAVLQVYWGECHKELVLQAHSAGVKVVPQVNFVLSKFYRFLSFRFMQRNCKDHISIYARIGPMI